MMLKDQQLDENRHERKIKPRLPRSTIHHTYSIHPNRFTVSVYFCTSIDAQKRHPSCPIVGVYPQRPHQRLKLKSLIKFISLGDERLKFGPVPWLLVGLFRLYASRWRTLPAAAFFVAMCRCSCGTHTIKKKQVSLRNHQHFLFSTASSGMA